jgi:ABC-type dipeptide/oligopeptide/nickel transport system permease component
MFNQVRQRLILQVIDYTVTLATAVKTLSQTVQVTDAVRYWVYLEIFPLTFWLALFATIVATCLAYLALQKSGVEGNQQKSKLDSIISRNDWIMES